MTDHDIRIHDLRAAHGGGVGTCFGGWRIAG